MRGLLLAEKPSVMRNIKEVYEKNKGSVSDILDFGAFHGHLYELREPKDYDAAWEDRFNTSYLPMIPPKFMYTPTDTKSVDMLLSKIRSGNYDFLVNACDAAREGEHIFWSFYETEGLSIPVKRLWLSSTTTGGIKKALSDLREASLYTGMREAAKYRAQFDWLIGMNFTRAASASLHKNVPIGRVQSPALKLLVDREKEIRDFISNDFFEVKGKFKVAGGTGQFIHLIAPSHKETRFADRSSADHIATAVKGKTGTIVAAKDEVKTTAAPTLYSLAELEKEANRYFKFKPDKTDEIAQKLYMDGLTTYPRTSSRFLPTDIIPDLPQHLASVASVPSLTPYVGKIGQPEIDAMCKKSYIDDAGVTDHHAIIPTESPANWSTLTKDEQAIYELVCKSFLAIFMPPYKVSMAAIIADIDGHLFRAQGRREVDKGYVVLYPTKASDVLLPVCKQGDSVVAEKIDVSKSSTKPPPRYSPGTFVTAMQTAGRDLSDAAMRSILRETAGLGTEASRTDILNKLEKKGFIEVKNNAYWALDKGIQNIDSIGDRTFCSALLTAQWEERLRGIEKGSYKGDFRQEMDAYIREETSYLLTNLKGTFGSVSGKCPVCGEDIINYGKTFICHGHKKDDPTSCPIWFPTTVGGSQLSEADIVILLSGGKTEPKELKTKKGQAWKAALYLDHKTGLQAERTDVGACPVCGSRVLLHGSGYFCEHHKEDDPANCPFWAPRAVGGTEVTIEDLQVVLSGDETSPKTVKKKTGKTWKVAFCLDEKKLFSLKSLEERKTLGVCPVCKKPVYAADNNFYCSGRSDQTCEWSFPRIIKGASLEDSDMADMLTSKKTRFITFVWASGSTGPAQLYLENGKLKWEFPLKT